MRVRNANRAEGRSTPSKRGSTHFLRTLRSLTQTFFKTREMNVVTAPGLPARNLCLQLACAVRMPTFSILRRSAVPNFG